MRSEEMGAPSEVARPARAIAVASPAVSLTSRAWVEVDLGAIAANTRAVRSILGARTSLLAVVKADAYGHGAPAVARTALACGAQSLGVATVSEGILLREAGIDAPILVLGYVTGRDSIEALAALDLRATVCSVEHARELARTLESLERRERAPNPAIPLGVHAKLDTGMNRLGWPAHRASNLLLEIASACRWLRLEGIFSHLATADDPCPDFALEQLRQFTAAVDRSREDGVEAPLLHIANSAATLRDEAFHLDLVRVGLAIYGLAPAPWLEGRIGLRSAMQVKARVTQVHRVEQGEAVSYGSAFVADRPLVAATVGIGYADGVPFRLTHRMTALVRGQRVRQLGRITMDQLVLDVTTVRGIATGDEVTLLGSDGCQSIGIDEWARALGTIPWEVPCLFKSRLPRIALEPRELAAATLEAPVGAAAGTAAAC